MKYSLCDGGGAGNSFRISMLEAESANDCERMTEWIEESGIRSGMFGKFCFVRASDNTGDEDRGGREGGSTAFNAFW